MFSGRFYEHRAATYIAALQFLITLAGTLMMVAAMRNWEEDGYGIYAITPWLHFIRSAGLLALFIPIVWLTATIIRSERSRFRLEPAIWKVVGIAIFLCLILVYSLPLFLRFIPSVMGPIQAE